METGQPARNDWSNILLQESNPVPFYSVRKVLNRNAMLLSPMSPLPPAPQPQIRKLILLLCETVNTDEWTQHAACTGYYNAWLRTTLRTGVSDYACSLCGWPGKNVVTIPCSVIQGYSHMAVSPIYQYFYCSSLHMVWETDVVHTPNFKRNFKHYCFRTLQWDSHVVTLEILVHTPMELCKLWRILRLMSFKVHWSKHLSKKVNQMMRFPLSWQTSTAW